MAPEDACSGENAGTDPLARPNNGGSAGAVTGVWVDESTAEATGDRHYRVAQGYCF